MRNTKFLAVLTGFIASMPFVADAAYPVYNPQVMANNGFVMTQNGYYMQPNKPTNIMPMQLQAASATNGRPMVNSVAQTNPNRITGSLPRVGSSATNAGRQYYQASDYNRLAESAKL